MKRLAILSLVVIMLFMTSYSSYAYSEIDSWFEAEFEQALNEWKLIPDDFTEKDLNENITRGEFSLLLVLAYKSLDYSLPSELESPIFTDTNSSHINTAYQLGFVSGYDDGTFKENNPIKRQEIFTMLFNFLKVVGKIDSMDAESLDKVLGAFSDTETISHWAKEATAMMTYYGIVKGSAKGEIKPLNNTSRIEGIVLAIRMLNISKDSKVIFDGAEQIAVTQVKAMEASSIDFNNSIYKVGYNSAKNTLVYGSGSEYTSGSEAEKHMVNITVDVWIIDVYGNKQATTRIIKVNSAIAKMVKDIFAEIFIGDEKFPIKNVTGYAWRSNSTSEHRLGLAIDINPNENYMIRSSGSIVVGSYWKPGVDPYSIKENGDVVKAFAKYGFAWGGNAWRSANDYMHFSYFGN